MDETKEKMTEASARKIISIWREQGKGIPSPYAAFSHVSTEKFAEAKGFLEGLAAERLSKAQNTQHDLCKAEIERLNARVEGLVEALEALEECAVHASECILSHCEAGEPTFGGYRAKYKGKWYQTRPIDETPKCECGLDETLSTYQGLKENGK